MVDLTKLARGKPCLIRVPHVCNGREDTTVWCHLRMIGISGYGMKSPDILGSFGCQPCHDVVDSRTPSDYSRAELRSMLLEGVARTINYLVSKDLLTW